MAKLQNMRGLQNFISELRACSGKEAEKNRVDKELGKIRKKFASSTSISEYDKKKYVWKLLYIYMLGYPVEFGHKQASDLIAAGKYAEKQVGYMACSILLSENDEFLRLVINSIRNDITCRNEAFQCLALNFIGSVGGSEMASLLTSDVAALLTNGAVRPIVRKKAALALLRMLRKSEENAEDVLPPETWSTHINQLLQEHEIGVLLGTTALLLGIVARSYHGYESAVPKLVAILARMRSREVGPDYTYYGIASPWLQVKTLRLLQYFPPPEDRASSKTLNDILKKIVTSNEAAKNLNKNNAQQSIVLEAIALSLAQDADPEVLKAATGLLGKFIGMREPNIKYLGLEAMMRLAEVPAVAETIDKHQKSIIGALKEADISVRRRALDLLFAMANPTNAKGIVEELLTYLTVADFSMREELVLKTAVLAEKFHPDLEWYADTMITLIERAGEFATKDVWHSTVQLVTNHEELHAYAANKTLDALKRGANHDAMVGVAAAIVGEYGQLAPETPLEDQFELLNQLFLSASTEGKQQLLSAFLRLSLREGIDPALKQRIESVFERQKKNLDAELQQRAVEYGELAKQPEVGRRNVLPLPHWDKRKSLLLRRLAEQEGATTDEQAERPAWMHNEDAAAADKGAVLEVGSPPPAPESNGVREEAPAEKEEAAEAAPSPVEDVPLIGIDDDDYSGPGLSNGVYPKASNPLDELLGGMTVSAAPPAQQSAPAPAAPAAYNDPFAPRLLEQPGAALSQTAQAAPSQVAAGPGLAPNSPASPAASGSPAWTASSPRQAGTAFAPNATGSPSASAASGSPRAGAVAASIAPVQAAAVARSLAGSSAAGSAPGTPFSQAHAAPSSLSRGSSQQPQSPPAATPAFPPVQLTGDVSEWFRRLTAADSGILYEDNYLQVGVKQGYQGPSGQVQLFLGNKSDFALTRVILAVPPQPQFGLQLGPVPPFLEPKKQLPIPLAIVAQTPFREPPRLQLGYALQAAPHIGVSQALLLPAAVTKFITPPAAQPPPDLFFQRWRALPGPPHKLTERVVRETPLSRGAIAAMLAALRLADLQGFDPQPENFVAAGTFCFAPMGAPPQQILVLVRLEVDVSNHKQFQVTVASPDVNLTPGVKDLLVRHLTHMPSA